MLEIFGDAAAGLIHVHHLKPLSDNSQKVIKINQNGRSAARLSEYAMPLASPS